MLEPVGLYVHIPFCQKKCPYCDFYSISPVAGVQEEYTAALLRELVRYLPLCFDTVYFGGGTPLLLGTRCLEKLMADLGPYLSPGFEATIEVNPASTTSDDLRALRGMGFTRLSVGVQSGNDTELFFLGRAHTAAQARETILAAASAGFSHISADLMIALEGQTEASLLSSIRFLRDLPIDHVSSYLLKVEPGTPFYQNRAYLSLPDEDESADLYLASVAALEEAGFKQYEISNFAKPGGQCLHNLKYWQCAPYLGLGPAAHSYLGGERFSYPRDLSGFLCSPQRVPQCPGGDFDETFLLAMRLVPGADIGELASRFSFDPAPLLKKAETFVRSGFLTWEKCRLTFTPKGFLVSNTILAELMAMR